MARVGHADKQQTPFTIPNNGAGYYWMKIKRIIYLNIFFNNSAFTFIIHGIIKRWIPYSPVPKAQTPKCQWK